MTRQETGYNNYAVRAREAMLNPQQTRAFIALNLYADDLGSCPSCGQSVDGYESSRMSHARSCGTLLDDVEYDVTPDDGRDNGAPFYDDRDTGDRGPDDDNR